MAQSVEEKRAKNRAYYEANKEIVKARSKFWAEANREKRLEIMRRWNAANPGRKKELANRYIAKMRETDLPHWLARGREIMRGLYLKNPEKFRLKSKEFIKANPAINRRQAAKYRAVSKRAFPCWASKFIVDEIYRLAVLRTKCTGVRWEVDHIVPLNNESVCGLHVEFNLRLIPKSINSSKRNKHLMDWSYSVKDQWLICL